MVYVDDLLPHGSLGLWCHLWSDGPLDELHALARAIGLQRAWFQNHADHPHYDLRPTKRQAAIARGALPVSCRELVALIQKARAERRLASSPDLGVPSMQPTEPTQGRDR